MPNTPPASAGNDGARDLNPDTLRADANAAMSEIQDAAKTVADEATAQASQIADQAKAQVAQVTDKAREAATDQKQLLAAQVGAVGDAMQKAAGELEANNGVSAQYARFIADNAEKLSTTLREKSVDDLIGIAQDFGRKQPAAFIGAAALLGFAASRFIMASAQRPAEPAKAAATEVQSWSTNPSSDTPDDAASGRVG